MSRPKRVCRSVIPVCDDGGPAAAGPFCVCSWGGLPLFCPLLGVILQTEREYGADRACGSPQGNRAVLRRVRGRAVSVHVQTDMPELFRQLTELGGLNEGDLCGTADGFRAAVKSVAEILAWHGITTIPDEERGYLECGLFFDDWYLYAVPFGSSFVYSLFKMREQEYDAQMGRYADGDTPGVTISFIELKTDILMDCLSAPTPENRVRLNEEINRVVAYGRQTHHRGLKEYFVRTEAEGAYLVAKLYTEYIASLSVEGSIPVPVRYAADYKKSGGRGRIPGFLEENNKAAGETVCDHEKIWIRDPDNLSEHERLAILATHAGNTSFFSFAAEVQFHAWFLAWWAKIPLPIIGRAVYASAIRADMSIGDAELTGPTPYYRPNSMIVKKQYACHRDRVKL